MSEDIWDVGFELAAVGLACLSADGHLLAANKALRERLGYAADILPPTAPEALFEAESLQRLRERMAAPGDAGEPLHVRWRCSDGELAAARLALARAPTEADAPPSHVATVLPDEPSPAENVDEMYRFLVESALDYAVMRLDKHGQVASWSAGAERTFGYRPDEMIGQHVSLIFTPEDREGGAPEQELADARAEGRAPNDRWQVRKDQTRLWASGVVNPLVDESGAPRGFVKILRDYTEQKLSEERHRHLSEHDTLTGLPNRAKFHAELTTIVGLPGATGSQGAVFFIDLDNFKAINDTLGHHHGDLLLVQVAGRLRDSVRRSDVVARLSGDEFGVIYTGLKRAEEAEHLAEKLVLELARPYQLDQHNVVCSGSIGFALFPKDGDAPERLLKNADLAMYRAKGQGRNNWKRYHRSMDAEISERRALGREIGTALDREELALHYQPLFTLTGQMCSVEALLRARGARLASLPTADFISLAEETGLIVPIGEWVLRTACQACRTWRTAGATGFRVSVNLSSRQLRQPTFLDTVQRVLDEAGLEPGYLELEVTENLLMEDDKVNIYALANLKSLGIRIAVDDFGTGYSSLGYLKHFPIDAIKLDHMFVRGLPDDEHDTAITSAVIGMAHSLGLEVVAEGVENDEQLEFLRRLGCNCVQGYLLSKPLSEEEIGRAIGEGSWTRQ